MDHYLKIVCVSECFDPAQYNDFLILKKINIFLYFWLIMFLEEL